MSIPSFPSPDADAVLVSRDGGQVGPMSRRALTSGLGRGEFSNDKIYRTDLANMFKMPIMGGIKLNHELNSVFARTTTMIDLDRYVNKGETGITGLSEVLIGTLDQLREKLAPYKKA